MNTWPFRRTRLMVVWATLLAWALYLSGLGSKTLWIDEADSLYFAVQPLRTILFGLCDPHPPGYYLLLKGVVQVGRSEFWLRLPSVLAATLAIPLAYIAARSLALLLGLQEPGQVAALSAWLLAVAPLHVWYAQEARMYALVTTLGLVAVWLALRFVYRPTMTHAALYASVAALALFVDQSAVLPLIVANLVWFWGWEHCQTVSGKVVRLGIWLGSQLLASVPFLLWWSNARYPAISDSGRFYQLTMLMRLLQRLGLKITLEDVRILFVTFAVLGTMLSIVLYWFLLRKRQALGKAWAIGVVILFALGTVGSVVPRLFTIKRLLLGLLPYALFASAWGLARLGAGRWQRTSIVIVCVILCGVNLLTIPKGSWREVTAWIETRAAEDDEIWVDALAVPAFEYYYQGTQKIHILRASELEQLQVSWEARQSSGDGHLWIVALVDPYRNLLDYVSPAAERAEVAQAVWNRVSVHAYEPARLVDSASIIVSEPPAWLLTWPSPLDPACQVEGETISVGGYQDNATRN